MLSSSNIRPKQKQGSVIEAYKLNRVKEHEWLSQKEKEKKENSIIHYFKTIINNSEKSLFDIKLETIIDECIINNLYLTQSEKDKLIWLILTDENINFTLPWISWKSWETRRWLTQLTKNFKEKDALRAKVKEDERRQAVKNNGDSLNIFSSIASKRRFSKLEESIRWLTSTLEETISLLERSKKITAAKSAQIDKDPSKNEQKEPPKEQKRILDASSWLLKTVSATRSDKNLATMTKLKEALTTHLRLLKTISAIYNDETLEDAAKLIVIIDIITNLTASIAQVKTKLSKYFPESETPENKIIPDLNASNQELLIFCAELTRKFNKEITDFVQQQQKTKNNTLSATTRRKSKKSNRAKKRNIKLALKSHAQIESLQPEKLEKKLEELNKSPQQAKEKTNVVEELDSSEKAEEAQKQKEAEYEVALQEHAAALDEHTRLRKKIENLQELHTTLNKNIDELNTTLDNFASGYDLSKHEPAESVDTKLFLGNLQEEGGKAFLSDEGNLLKRSKATKITLLPESTFRVDPQNESASLQELENSTHSIKVKIKEMGSYVTKLQNNLKKEQTVGRSGTLSTQLSNIVKGLTSATVKIKTKRAKLVEEISGFTNVTKTQLSSLKNQFEGSLSEMKNQVFEDASGTASLSTRQHDQIKNIYRKDAITEADNSALEKLKKPHGFIEVLCHWFRWLPFVHVPKSQIERQAFIDNITERHKKFRSINKKIFKIEDLINEISATEFSESDIIKLRTIHDKFHEIEDFFTSEGQQDRMPDDYCDTIVNLDRRIIVMRDVNAIVKSIKDDIDAFNQQKKDVGSKINTIKTNIRALKGKLVTEFGERPTAQTTLFRVPEDQPKQDQTEQVIAETIMEKAMKKRKLNMPVQENKCKLNSTFGS